jgi:single-strand DNA-binding protein
MWKTSVNIARKGEQHMASVNKAILIGNLGKDPELRYTPSGQAVASFPLATTDRFKDKEGNWQERTDWHNIVVWGRQGETAKEYLRKGRSAYVEGRIQTRSYDDREGNQKWITEIVASRVQFLGGRGDSGGAAGASRSEPDADESVTEPLVSNEDDDLPF